MTTEILKENQTIVIRPAIAYTIQNAEMDAGNVTVDLSGYVKKVDYDKDKEILIDEDKLATALVPYTTESGLQVELGNYTTKTLLNESLSLHPTFEITDEIKASLTTLSNNCAKLNTANTFTQPQYISSKAEFPLSIMSPSKFGKNDGFKIKLGDSQAQAVMGYWKTSAYGPYIYFKLQGEAAQVIVRKNNINLLGNTDVSGTLTTTGNITAPNITSITSDIETITDQMLNVESELTNKANTTHTHTISDITDYSAPTIDTSNLAKLNETNTFTGAQLFDGNIMIRNITSVGKINADYVNTTDLKVMNNITAPNITALENGKADVGHTHTVPIPTEVELNASKLTTYSGNTVTLHLPGNPLQSFSFNIKFYFNSSGGMFDQVYLGVSRGDSGFAQIKMNSHSISYCSDIKMVQNGNDAIFTVEDMKNTTEILGTEFLSISNNPILFDVDTPLENGIDYLETKIDSKANTTHSHTISDITDLDYRLNTLQVQINQIIEWIKKQDSNFNIEITA